MKAVNAASFSSAIFVFFVGLGSPGESGSLQSHFPCLSTLLSPLPCSPWHPSVGCLPTGQPRLLLAVGHGQPATGRPAQGGWLHTLHVRAGHQQSTPGLE